MPHPFCEMWSYCAFSVLDIAGPVLLQENVKSELGAIVEEKLIHFLQELGCDLNKIFFLIKRNTAAICVL
jgi:hypothetical protein